MLVPLSHEPHALKHFKSKLRSRHARIEARWPRVNLVSLARGCKWRGTQQRLVSRVRGIGLQVGVLPRHSWSRRSPPSRPRWRVATRPLRPPPISATANRASPQIGVDGGQLLNLFDHLVDRRVEMLPSTALAAPRPENATSRPNWRAAFWCPERFARRERQLFARRTA